MSVDPRTARRSRSTAPRLDFPSPDLPPAALPVRRSCFPPCASPLLIHLWTKVLHPVKSRRLIERSAQHAYDLVERVIDGPGQAVVHRVALAVVRAGVRVLPPTKHLHVVDNSVAYC